MSAALKWGGFALGRDCLEHTGQPGTPFTLSSESLEPSDRGAAKPGAAPHTAPLLTDLVQFGKFSSRLKSVSGLTG